MYMKKIMDSCQKGSKGPKMYSSPAQFNQGLVDAAKDGKLNPEFKAKVMASDAAKKQKTPLKKGLLDHLNKPGVVKNDPTYGKPRGNKKGGIKNYSCTHTKTMS